jgi:hypothetical protein
MLGFPPGTPFGEAFRAEVRFWLTNLRLRTRMQDVTPWRLRCDRPYDRLFERGLDNFASITTPFRPEFSRWRTSCLQNGYFDAGDAEFYYSMVRRHQPARILEVGAGWSTRFATSALRRNRRGQLTVIDPEPRCPLPPGVRHLCQRFEDTDPQEFAALQPGDILFIDSSHTAEEARLHTQLLERLPAGVFIHHHDICYPYLPMYDEEPVVLDFYHTHPSRYRVLCGLVYATWQSRERCAVAVPSLRWNPYRSPRSFWAEKT